MDTLKRQNQERRQAELSSRTKYEEFSRTMAQSEQQLEVRLREQVQQLRERHARECFELEAQWMNGPKQRLFTRSSQKPRILRLQMQLVLLAQVSGIADKEFQMQNDFEAARAGLDHKYREELDRLLQACEVRRAEFCTLWDILAKRFTIR
jgi:hypothetical protein